MKICWKKWQSFDTRLKKAVMIGKFWFHGEEALSHSCWKIQNDKKDSLHCCNVNVESGKIDCEVICLWLQVAGRMAKQLTLFLLKLFICSGGRGFYSVMKTWNWECGLDAQLMLCILIQTLEKLWPPLSECIYGLLHWVAQYGDSWSVVEPCWHVARSMLHCSHYA